MHTIFEMNMKREKKRAANAFYEFLLFMLMDTNKKQKNKQTIPTDRMSVYTFVIQS